MLDYDARTHIGKMERRAEGHPLRHRLAALGGCGEVGYCDGVPEFDETAAPAANAKRTLTARLEDGPLKGSSIETEPVEGRPPKTIDVPAGDEGACRYCLAGWVQSGQSAAYTFLYRV